MVEVDEKGLAAGLILYGTSACHLCDVAAEMLDYYSENDSTIAYEKVDISESDELYECYGVRIPVLRRRDELELGWPFSLEELKAFLAV